MRDEAPRPGTPKDDLIVPFQVGETAVRGRLVRLGPAVDDLLSRHDFPMPLKQLVGETAALVALLGASLKFEGKLILQIQGDGPVSMVVADYTVGGMLRATATIREGAEDTVARRSGRSSTSYCAKGTW